MFRRAAIVALAVLAAAGTGLGMERFSVRGDKFYVGEEEFRIWGMNVVRGLNLTDAQLHATVDRLGFLGCNMARLHTLGETHYGDIGWSCGVLPIEKDTARELINVEDFWRLMNAMRAKGIYICIDVIIGRHFKPGESAILVTDEADRKAWEEAIGQFDRWNGTHKRAMTYLPIFDERCETLTQEYMQQVLGLRNPKTGFRLAEDPQLAMITTCNEGYGFRLIRAKGLHRSMPEYFGAKLRGRWCEWLAGKYGSDEKLAEAWRQDGVKGLVEGESLSGSSVALAPTHDEAKEYSAKRDEDLLAFLTEIDMAFQGRMQECYRQAGFAGPTMYGDFNNSHAGTARLWAESDLCPYLEDHEYPDANVDFFRWSNIVITRTRVPAEPHPYAWGKPYWRSEYGMTNASRIPSPLFTAVYQSLTGMDGITWFAWNLRYHKNRFQYKELVKGEVGALDFIGEIPWQLVYRASGRLYKSREIKALEDVEALKRIFSRANVETDQVYRANGKGLLRVETEHFVAAACDTPQKLAFEKAEMDITSDKCNVVIAEFMDEGQADYDCEVTAVGLAGGTYEDRDDFEQWEDVTFVTGTIGFGDRQVKAVIHLDDGGDEIRRLAGQGSAMELVDGVRLYRVIFEEAAP